MSSFHALLIVSIEIYQSQRRFFLCILLGLLLPLSLYILDSCYAEGRIRAYGPVTITHSFNLKVENTPKNTTAGGSRWGGSNAQSKLTKQLHIWGKTSDGALCFVDTKMLIKNQVSRRSFPAEGAIVNTWYYLPKKRGSWGWTVTAGHLFVPWLIIFLVLLCSLGIRKKSISSQST